MQFEETRSIRAFVGRITPGDDVIEALTLVCNANGLRAATLRLTGTLSGVELGAYDATTTSYTRTFSADGPLQIANLTGCAAMVGDRSMLQLDALLAAHGPLGAQLVFGELLRRASCASRSRASRSPSRFRMVRVSSEGSTALPASRYAFSACSAAISWA